MLNFKECIGKLMSICFEPSSNNWRVWYREETDNKVKSVSGDDPNTVDILTLSKGAVKTEFGNKINPPQITVNSKLGY